MAALLAPVQLLVVPPIETHLHGAAGQRLKRVEVVIRPHPRVSYVSAIAQVEQGVFRVLFLDRRNIGVYRTVEGIGNILMIRHAFHYAVLFLKLLRLQSDKRLTWSTVNRIKNIIDLFILIGVFVYELQH